MSNGTKMKRFRTEFTDASLPHWNVQVGAGMAVTVGAGGLTVTTGTTNGSETILTSVDSFEVPVLASFGLKLSQKIAGQDFMLELVADDDLNADANQVGVDETVVAAWRISGSDSTTTTVARAEVRNGQAARAQSGNITVASETSDGVFDIAIDEDEVWFYNKAIDSTSSKAATYKRDSVSPHPGKRYRLRYRIKNTAVPASSTAFTSLFCTAREITSTQVELRAPIAGASAAEALPVTVANTPNVTLGSTALATSTTVTGTTIAKVLSAATTNAANLKNAAARLYGYHLANTSAAWKFVRIYNKATAPTVGTDSPALVIPLAPGATAVVHHTVPVSFGTGLGISITGASPDLDATAVAVGDVVGHLLYA